MALKHPLLLPALVLLSVGGNLAAQEATPADRAAVLAAVDSLFSSMSRHDTLASRAILLPGATFYSLAPGRPPRSTSDTAYIRSLARDAVGLKERIWNPTVWLHGPIAQVWTPYDFHVDGKFSHCGVDSFSLIRTEAGWRIAAATYTIETTGCPESPLGPLSPP
jgi:hypothetical protein